ncbi:MAG: ribonuclease H-like domain-containing protein [Clostridia bacterium]|nr:ribonuclease H-like domain-containing protein [Clostridia bacterium]
MRTIETILNQTAQQEQDQLDAWRLLGDPEQVVFIDIETTGFSRLYDSIYLIGLVYLEEGHFVAKQYLAGSLADEVQVLEKALDQLQNFKIFVTYNGDMFD